jgi:hypothetical protein
MTVTPDDSVRLQHVGITLLANLTFTATLTLLLGNDVTMCPVNALT